MLREFFVALQLEVAHHFIERSAAGRTRRLEPPATFRATKTPKTLPFNPYQLPAHGEQILQAPIWIVCRASYIHGRVFVREQARFWGSFEMLVHVSCVLKRSVLLSIRIVSSVVLIGLR